MKNKIVCGMILLAFMAMISSPGYSATPFDEESVQVAETDQSASVVDDPVDPAKRLQVLEETVNKIEKMQQILDANQGKAPQLEKSLSQVELKLAILILDEISKGLASLLDQKASGKDTQSTREMIEKYQQLLKKLNESGSGSFEPVVDPARKKYFENEIEYALKMLVYRMSQKDSAAQVKSTMTWMNKWFTQAENEGIKVDSSYYKRASELITKAKAYIGGSAVDVPDNVEEPDKPDPGIDQKPDQGFPGLTAAEKARLDNYRGGKLSPSEFARILGPAARESSRRTGVPASVILAQAALETGWGQSSIGNAKNLFGIKGRGPAGSILVPTKEFLNGQWVTIKDSFRKYHSWAESIEDHGNFLRENSRYKKAFNYKSNPDQFAREIHKAGYATDPGYSGKLISIMKSNNFYAYNV